MAIERRASGRSILITGTSTGIGAACMRQLEQLGFQVFAGVRKQADYEALAQSSTSSRIMPILLDITDANSVAAAANMVAHAVGSRGLAGLINNAGVIIQGPIELLPMDVLRGQFEVNVFGQIAVTQAFLPLLRLGHGRVVNLGAATGRVTVPLLGAISASKAAMESLTDALRMELRPWKISVSIVEPGAIHTSIFKKAAQIESRWTQNLTPDAHGLYADAMAAVQKSLATGKLSSPDIVVAAIIDALTAKNPKTRYVVGSDARILTTLRFLPDRLRDHLLLSQLGLSKGSNRARTASGVSAQTRQ